MGLMRVLACVACVCLLGGAAGASPDGETIGGKHEGVATALTVTGIVVPAVLFANMFRPGIHAGDGQFMLGTLGAVMLIPGPALGHWYANRFGGRGMLTRFGGVVLAVTGASFIEDARRCARGEVVPDGCQGGDREIGIGLAAVGIGAVVTSWAYDLMTSRREVRRYNERRRVHVAPFASRTSSGLALGATF
jgi:hypothetical protein